MAEQYLKDNTVITPKDSLKHKAASGMFWTAIQKYSTMLIGFISGIILARLLTPEDYGAIGMLSIFMSLAEVFIDAGFGSALIQKKSPTTNDYSTVFYFNIGMSLLLYLVLFFSAPAIADYYRMPILRKILRIQGLILFVYAFSIIQRNQIRKNLQFRKLSMITIITSIVSLIVTVVMAYRGCGVWSLVAQNFIGASIPCVFFWVSVNWKPSMAFSWASFKELFGFGSFMFFTSFLTTFSQRISSLLIGRKYDSAAMGYYTKATTTSQYATLSIAGVMIQTTYPLYASVQDDRDRLINLVKRITSTLAYISIPFLCVLIIIAKPLFLLLYSERWLACVPYFQVLCFGGIAGCLLSVNQQAIAAIGKSRIFFVWTVVKECAGITLQVVGLTVWGMKGLLIGNALSAWFSYFVNIALVSKHVGYKSFQQIKDLVPVLIVSIIAAFTGIMVTMPLHLSLYADGLLKSAIFLLVYFGWSLIFKPDAFKYTLSVVRLFNLKAK